MTEYKQFRRTLLATLGCLLIPVAALAQVPSIGFGAEVPATTTTAEQGSEEGALFLLLPNGAQGVALGRAMTALSSSESAFWNPAGLANLDGHRLLLMRGEHVAGEALGFSGIYVRSGRGAAGLSYQLLDAGTQELTDGQGQTLGSITVRSHQALVSGAARLGTRVRLGANLKTLQFRVTCRGPCLDGNVSASTYAVDLGAQLRPLGDHPLSVGIMLAHLGPDFQVDDADQADPLPSRIRLGAAYEILDRFVEEDIGLHLIAEVEDRIRDPGSLSLLVGAQFLAGSTDQVFVRGGYIFGERNQTDGAGVGFGVRYERFEFGIARSLARGGPSSGNERVHVTLGLAL